MADINLTIVGLERVGASLGLALKRYQEKPNATHNFTITGYDRDGKLCREAKKRDALDNCARNLGAAVEDADIVFLDEPFSEIRSTLEKIGPVLKGGCVVLEAGPLKQPPIEWSQHYLPESAYLVGLGLALNPEHLYFLETDPANVSADLFNRGKWVVAAGVECPAEAVQLASDLGKLIGLEPHYMDPMEHDGLVAAVEGLPILMALAMFNTAHQAPSWKEMRMLANPAFARAAAVLERSPGALYEFLVQDRDNILHYLDRAIEHMQLMRYNLAHPEEHAALVEMISQAAKSYRLWEHRRYIDKWDEEEKIETPSMARALFGGLAGVFGRKKDDEDDE